jgi:hypothetical protein
MGGAVARYVSPTDASKIERCRSGITRFDSNCPDRLHLSFESIACFFLTGEFRRLEHLLVTSAKTSTSQLLQRRECLPLREPSVTKCYEE